jgi:cell cycle serine/threonine-protein kinase CDC5/MSD2
MSAQVYPRVPYVSTHRNPLKDVNYPQKPYIAPDTLPAKQAERPKQPPSPPLPRQNSKVTPPSPPKVIVDKSRDAEFARVGLLGEGGFARVYEVKDERGSRLACKVVTKSSLKTKKAKTKVSRFSVVCVPLTTVMLALRRN